MPLFEFEIIISFPYIIPSFKFTEPLSFVTNTPYPTILFEVVIPFSPAFWIYTEELLKISPFAMIPLLIFDEGDSLRFTPSRNPPG